MMKAVNIMKKFKGISIIRREYGIEASSEEEALMLLNERDLENNEHVLYEYTIEDVK